MKRSNLRRFLLGAFLVMCLERQSSGQGSCTAPGSSATADFEFKLTGYIKSKCFFSECPSGMATGSCTASSPPKIYLISTITTSEQGSDDLVGFCGNPGPIDHRDWNYFVQETIQYDHLTCIPTTNYSGNFNYDISGGCFGPGEGPTNISETISSTGTWSGIPWGSTQGYFLDAPSSVIQNEVSPTMNNLAWIYTNVDCNDILCQSYDAVTDNAQQVVTLQNEYTDDMLRQDAITLMPAYPSYWTIVPTFFSEAAFALYSLSPDHETATCQKFIYHVHLTDYQANVSYKITWTEVTRDDSGNVISSVNKQAILTGSTSPVDETYSPDYEVQVPAQPGTIDEENFSDPVAVNPT